MKLRLASSIVCASLASACAAPVVQDGAVPDGPPEGMGPTPTASPAASAAPTVGSLPGMYVCKVDADCALTTHPGCCSCCPCTDLHAISVAELKKEEDDCAVVECSRQCDKATLTCPKCVNPADEGMHARCIDGSCTLVER